MYKLKYLSTALALVTMSAGTAFAQDENSGDAESVDKSTAGLDQVIVTATKRVSSVQDTSLSITAISGDVLEKRSQVGMEEYLRAVPGINVQSGGAGLSTLVFRGVASDPISERATVGIYFGETPITGLGEFFSGSPDLKMVDINRVEVLRGPQGTLYGSGSMGGTLRVIPNAPDSQEFSGNIAAGYSNTANLGGDNYTIEATVNVPIIEDVLAVRATGYILDNSGVVQNVVASDPVMAARVAGIPGVPALADTSDIGSDRYEGVRISALFTPNDKLKVTGSYIWQKVDQDGSLETDTTLGGNFSQGHLQTRSGNQFNANEMSIFNAVIEYDLGFGQLTSSSSIIDQTHGSEQDFSFVIGLPTDLSGDNRNDAFIQEVRLTSSLDGPFQFIVGGYYQKTDTLVKQNIQWTGTDPDFIFGGATIIDLQAAREIKQYAAFGEVSYDITEDLTATGGVRFFKYDEQSTTVATGIFVGPVDTNEFVAAENSGETFKANLSYRASDELLLYTQWSQGFRNGYPHLIVPAGACDVDSNGIVDGTGLSLPGDVEPDTLDSYEVGAKWTSEDRRTEVNGAVYYIDWSGIPVTHVPGCQFGITLNAGAASSMGGELEVRTLIGDNITVNGGISITDAKLTETVSEFNLTKDDKLPGSSNFSANFGIEYAFDLAGHDAFARADYSYLGKVNGPLLATNGLEAGNYSIVDFVIGTDIKNTSVELYVKNVFNDDSISWILSATDSFALRNRPRTIGFKVRQNF